MAKEPYYQWVKKMVKEINLPFNIEIYIQSHIHEPTHVSIVEAERLKVIISKLKRENEKLQLKLN